MSEPSFPGFEVPVFDDGKDPDAMRTIGEVTRALGIRQHVLRYWEEQFPMLNPVKRSGGRRYYRPQDVALVAQIDQLVHHEGYTLRGARLALEGKGKLPDPELAALGKSSEPTLAMDTRTKARLQSLRDDLAAALRQA